MGEHGFSVGDVVRFAYSSAAVSCQSSNRVVGRGRIARIFETKNEPPIGIEVVPGSGRLTCVWPSEITHTDALVDTPPPVTATDTGRDT